MRVELTDKLGGVAAAIASGWDDYHVTRQSFGKAYGIGSLSRTGFTRTDWSFYHTIRWRTCFSHEAGRCIYRDLAVMSNLGRQA